MHEMTVYKIFVKDAEVTEGRRGRKFKYPK
jgi:hypothetical protein